MPRNPDNLMNMKPAELKSLSDGEFRIFCGMKFHALERNQSRLEKYFWAIIITIITATVLSLIV